MTTPSEGSSRGAAPRRGATFTVPWPRGQPRRNQQFAAGRDVPAPRCVETVEIDPVVVNVAKEYFSVAESPIRPRIDTSAMIAGNSARTP